MHNIVKDKDTINIQECATNYTLPPVNSDLKPKSTFYPLNSKGNFIKTFYDLVATDFRNIKQYTTKAPNFNISSQERNAITILAKNEEIVIKSGEGIVILDRKPYMDEAFRILSDEKDYKIIKNPLSVLIHNQWFYVQSAY